LLEVFDIGKAMAQPGPQAAQRALRRQTPPNNIKIDLKTKIAFWTLISRLKKEGLINNAANKKIQISDNGEKYLHLKHNKLSRTKRYSNKNLPEADITLVIFDIPERERVKRDWIRFQLEKFYFKALQKSVWWGITGLPKEFIKDLKKYEILDYIHIFSVKKKGTISTIINSLVKK
jgi:DNA-binding transcriptional regulator PaaX